MAKQPQLLILLLLACLGAHPVCARWISAKWGPYEIYGDVSERKMRQVVSDLHYFREAMWTLFPEARGHDGFPLRIIVCKTHGRFRALTGTRPHHGDRVLGMFYATSAGDTIVIDAAVGRDLWRQLVFHEYTHRLLHKAFGLLPLWLDEGLATIFETTELGKDAAQIGTARTSERRGGGWKSDTRALLTSVPEEGVDTPVYYERVWTFIHFCLFSEGHRYRDAFNRYMAGIIAGTSAARDFESTFGVSWDEMDKEIEDYRRHGHYSGLSIVYKDLPPPPELEFQQVEDAEIDRVYAEQQFFAKGDDDSWGQLVGMYLKHPNDPGLAEALVYPAMQRGAQDAATDYARQAVAGGSLDPFSRYLVAYSLYYDDGYDWISPAETRRILAVIQPSLSKYGDALQLWTMAAQVYARSVSSCTPGDLDQFRALVKRYPRENDLREALDEIEARPQGDRPYEGVIPLFPSSAAAPDAAAQAPATAVSGG